MATSRGKNKTKMEKLLDMVQELDAHDREALDRMGVSLPIFDGPEQAQNNPYRYGVRCVYCGGIALEFVGTRFRQREGGIADRPDPSLPLRQQSWTQSKLDPNTINRSDPVCQCCGGQLDTSFGNLRPRAIVSLEQHEHAQQARSEWQQRIRYERPQTGLPGSTMVDAQSQLQPGLADVTVTDYSPDETPSEGSLDADDRGIAAGDVVR